VFVRSDLLFVTVRSFTLLICRPVLLFMVNLLKHAAYMLLTVNIVVA